MCATYFVIRYVTENDLKCTPLNIFLLVVSSVLWLDSCANTGTHIGEQVAQLLSNFICLPLLMVNKVDHKIFPKIRSVVLREVANRGTDRQTDKRRIKNNITDGGSK